MAINVPEEIKRLEQASATCVRAVNLMNEALLKFYEAVKKSDFKTADTLREVAVEAFQAHLDSIASAHRTLMILRH